MREKLKNMMWGEPTGEYIPNTIAEYAIMRNIFETMPELPVAESVTFDGISNGKRNTEVQASVYDAMMAEIMDDRNAEKARVRNRRKADRKYKLTPKMRKEQEYMRNWNVCMKMVNFGTWDDIPIVEGRVRSAEKIARADYAVECGNRDDALAYHSDYLDMAIDHGERLEYLRKQIRKLDYERMVIANYDREIKYEQNRVNELMRIADTIMEGECY